MNRAQHRAPIVRATRVLQHVAAGLATILVVGVVGVVGARVGAPDVPSRAGSSPTLVLPDEPPRGGVQAPVVGPPTTSAPSAVVEPEPVAAPRPVVTPPPQQPPVVIVHDPTPTPPAAPAPEPEPVLVAPQEPPEQPKPATTAQHRQRRDPREHAPRQDPETTNTQRGQDTQLCAVVCVQLDDDTRTDDPPYQDRQTNRD